MLSVVRRSATGQQDVVLTAAFQPGNAGQSRSAVYIKMTLVPAMPAFLARKFSLAVLVPFTLE